MGLKEVKYFFAQQSVNFGNLLPQEAMEAGSGSRFEKELDKFIGNSFISRL